MKKSVKLTTQKKILLLVKVNQKATWLAVLLMEA